MYSSHLFCPMSTNLVLKQSYSSLTIHIQKNTTNNFSLLVQKLDTLFFAVSEKNKYLTFQTAVLNISLFCCVSSC